MTAEQDKLQIGLNRLLLEVGRLKREHFDPADFWPAFAGKADSLVDAASPEDYDWVVTQIDSMLRREGLIAQTPST